MPGTAATLIVALDIDNSNNNTMNNSHTAIDPFGNPGYVQDNNLFVQQSRSVDSCSISTATATHGTDTKKNNNANVMAARHSLNEPNFLDKVFFELPPELNKASAATTTTTYSQPRIRTATWDSTSMSIPAPPINASSTAASLSTASNSMTSNNFNAVNYAQQQPQHSNGQSNATRDRTFTNQSDSILCIGGRATGYNQELVPSSSSVCCAFPPPQSSRPLIQVPESNNTRIPLRNFRFGKKERKESNASSSRSTTKAAPTAKQAKSNPPSTGKSTTGANKQKPMSLADAGKTVGNAPIPFSKLGNKISKMTERIGNNPHSERAIKMEQENYQRASNSTALVHEGSFA